MIFDRVGAKYEAKRIIRQTQPSPILVTVAYLLLTSGIGMVVHFFLADPFSESLNYIMQGYDPMEVYAYVFGGTSAILAIFVNLLLSVYTTIVAFGYNSYTLRLVRKQESGFSDLFDGFSMVVKVVLTNVLTSVFVFLWSMLFFIPGIIAAFSYSQAVYCLLDDPEISPLEAIRRSKTMMRGEKFNYFIVELSFFGWMFAAGVVAVVISKPFSGGNVVIAGAVETLVLMIFDLWIMPYKWIVLARFYTNLRDGQYGYSGPRVEF